MKEDLIVSVLKQNDYVMRQLDDESQADEIADCYIQHSPTDAYEFMKSLEESFGWTGSMDNCELLDEVMQLIESEYPGLY